MRVVSKWIGVAASASIAILAACASGDMATAPSEDHPAIPQLAAAACAVWSCQVGQCQQDPAHYGACCIQAASAEYPATSAPSCTGPKPGTGLPEYCDNTNLQQACLEKINATGWQANCYATPYSWGNTGEAIFGNTGDVFNECQSSGGGVY